MFVPDNDKASEGKKEKNLCGVLARVEAGGGGGSVVGTRQRWSSRYG